MVAFERTLTVCRADFHYRQPLPGFFFSVVFFSGDEREQSKENTDYKYCKRVTHLYILHEMSLVSRNSGKKLKAVLSFRNAPLFLNIALL